MKCGQLSGARNYPASGMENCEFSTLRPPYSQIPPEGQLLGRLPRGERSRREITWREGLGSLSGKRGRLLRPEPAVASPTFVCLRVERRSTAVLSSPCNWPPAFADDGTGSLLVCAATAFVQAIRAPLARPSAADKKFRGANACQKNVDLPP